MAKLSEDELEPYLSKQQVVEPPGDDEPPEQPLVPPAGNPPEEKAPQPLLASSGGPSDGQGEDGSGSAGGEIVMFGRRTFALQVGADNDKTDFWNNMQEQPWEAAETKPISYVDQAEAATDGIIPVAAMVKIMHGFHDDQGGGNHLALLLAGNWGF